jgi:23S rRNA (pseudouridine1915-N3)-methyltransferase
VRLALISVGRLRAAPEQALAADYIARAHAAGRALGLSPIELIEVEARPPADPRLEAAALYKASPDHGKKILLDERGEDMGSRRFAEKIAAWRDEGQPAVCFWIGGADGVAQSVRDQADHKIAFGRWTWPHRLARVMAAEQIYRAVTILSHSPYHRD